MPYPLGHTATAGTFGVSQKLSKTAKNVESGMLHNDHSAFWGARRRRIDKIRGVGSPYDMKTFAVKYFTVV